MTGRNERNKVETALQTPLGVPKESRLEFTADHNQTQPNLLSTYVLYFVLSTNQSIKQLLKHCLICYWLVYGT